MKIDSILLPYQKKWVSDKSPVKFYEKSRRIGVTWAEALDNVLTAMTPRGSVIGMNKRSRTDRPRSVSDGSIDCDQASEPDDRMLSGGMNVWYIGYNKDMAKEYIDTCAEWAKKLNQAVSKIYDNEIIDEDKKILSYSLNFHSCFKITALSGRPSNLHGKQGKAVIDEAAFHDDLKETMKAALAFLIWGGKVAVISTHFGEDNVFNEYIEDIRKGRLNYSLHRTTFDDAVNDRLYERVRAVTVRVLDSSPEALNDKEMGGINYVDSHAYEAVNIDISQITPIRTFDNMPRELAGLAYRNFSSWQNYAASIGTNNSLAQYSHHILNRLSYQECANLATDSMISKAIDVITREIFKSGGKWTDAHLDIENFEMILNSLNFYDKVRLAVQRALEYGGAFIYINTDDTNLSLPLYLNEKTAGINKITGLTVIEPWQAAPVQVNSFNPLKDNYMEPDLWWVLGASTTVHKTRLIPVVFYSVPDLIKPLYNYLGGLPLSFYMKNYVSNADTVRQSINDLILRFRTKIIKTTAQKIADPQTKARVKYMNATSNNLATLLLAKDEEWIETVTSLTGMDNLLSQMYELMTASTRGIPVTKLLGLSPRGFNATGEYDENNFYDVIDGYAKSTVVPLMEGLAEYILCFKAGILSEPKYEFNPRKQIRPKEQAEINNLKADYISKLIMSGVVTGKDAIKAISEDNFKFDWIDLESYNEPDNPEVEKEIFNTWMDSFLDSSVAPLPLNDKVEDEWKESEHDRDENGRFTGNGNNESNSNDIQAKIDSLKNIDFSKDNVLPNLNKDILEKYGLEDKPVLLKKEIIDKNKREHSDIDEALSIRIIGNALYRPEAILKGNKDKPDYYNFISRTDDNHSDIVLIELSNKKDNYEIINYHIIKNRQRKQKEKRDKSLRENS